MDIHLVVQLRLLSQMMISHIGENIMGIEPISDEERDNMKRTITKPRPGHADLIGGMKYNHRDLRNVLERSSARDSGRVAVGAVSKILLEQLDIHV